MSRAIAESALARRFARAFRLVAVLGWSAVGLAGPAIAQECASTVASRTPVRVEYDSANGLGARSALVFEPSESGVLTARDEATDVVLWTFQPPEITAAAAHTRLMTDLAVLRFDANNDGYIDASGGDKVWLYFGLKRGGPLYYALDVSARAPEVLWSAGAEAMPGLGEAWSTPTIARVRVSGARQNGEHFVLVIGGGYRGDGAGGGTGGAGGAGDSAIEAVGAGNRLFMLDAASGQLLWSAGDQEGVDRVLPLMTHAFSARVAVLDVDADGYADRLYAADTGARVWRFDIWNGRVAAELVTGGVLSILGLAPPSPSTSGSSPSDARRFFSAPDVALIQERGGSAWYNLAIGSGDGDDVHSTGIQNRFYSIRDREPFVRRSQEAYDSATPIFDTDLTDITAAAQGAQVPPESAGWKLALNLNGTGEKVVAESLTANGVILFTTYEPVGLDAAGCDMPGTSRIYAVTVGSGDAALDLNTDAEVTTDDRFDTLAQPGVAGEPRIEWVLPGDSSGQPENPGGGAPGTPGSPQHSTRCYVGTELLNTCVPFGTLLRTFWKRESIN
jgi:hypothetical protein